MAYSIFYTLFTINNQILPDDNRGKVNFNFITLKAKGYKCILIQKESITVLTVFIAITTILITGIALTATSNTRNIKVPYYIYYHKSYHTKKKYWILYPHLK